MSGIFTHLAPINFQVSSWKHSLRMFTECYSEPGHSGVVSRLDYIMLKVY